MVKVNITISTRKLYAEQIYQTTPDGLKSLKPLKPPRENLSQIHIFRRLRCIVDTSFLFESSTTFYYMMTCLKSTHPCKSQ
jgi:hypothetical protein